MASLLQFFNSQVASSALFMHLVPPCARNPLGNISCHVAKAVSPLPSLPLPTCFAPPPLGADVEQWLHLKWQLPLDAPRVGHQLGCFFPAFMAPQRSLKWATPTDRSAVCFDILIVASFGNIVWWPHCPMTFNVTICATFNCLPPP